MEPVFLWLIAASMAFFTAWLLKRGSVMATVNQATIILFALSSMAIMFLSAVIYLYNPVFITLILLIILNMVTMSVFLVPFALTTFFGDRRLEDIRRVGSFRLRSWIVGTAIVFLVTSEIFMGWTFAIADGSLQAVGGVHAAYSAFVSSASSYWFVFTMTAEMALTFVTLRRKFPGKMGWIVGAQPIMMFLSPTAIDSQGWVDFSFIASSAIMVVVFVYATRYLYKDHLLSTATVGYLMCLISAYTLMMAGLIVWFADQDAIVFVLSILFQMTVYFYVVLEEKRLGSHRQH
ncbi:MAG TPA: hypothetical protein VEJ19_05270 [Nitrososphaerales archaeon]|nr:hypothetical protein [Nitrososphaerales archaeon]